MDMLLAFMTGLTTGGLSCLAVQGGLLAGSVAHEVEQTMQGQPKDGRLRKARARQPAARTPAHAARPILLFLVAKVAAYTLLGALLGLLGSVLQLSATTRAVLQLAIGIFMVGTGLRMFNVHPIFRYFALEPPRVVTRYIRRTAKGEASAVTPLFLGALTVLIPCGVTQAMMAVAMGSGNPLTGAALMLAFTLGTSPVFFTVAYLATRLGARLEAGFMRLVAVVVLVLGLVSIDSGLTLAGWPYSVTNLRVAAAAQAAEDAEGGAIAQEPQSVPAAQAPGRAAGQARVADAKAPVGRATAPGALAGMIGPAVASSGVVTITVAGGGYLPAVSHARAEQPLKLALVTNKTYTCARAFVIPSLSIEKMLPPTGRTVIDLPAQKAGTKLFFSCSMGMYSGVILFDA